MGDILLQGQCLFVSIFVVFLFFNSALTNKFRNHLMILLRKTFILSKIAGKSIKFQTSSLDLPSGIEFQSTSRAGRELFTRDSIVSEINSKKRQSQKLVYLYHCNVIISNSAEKSFFLENRKHRKNLITL